MKKLAITHIAPGILRLRCTEKGYETLAERYSIITLPKELQDSGMHIEDNAILLPDRRKLCFSIEDGESEAFKNLKMSLSEAFAGNYTDYQEILGTPKTEKTGVSIPEEQIPAGIGSAICFSLTDTELFYGAGEGSNDRIELRGRSYQNWVRYQYNEIPIPFIMSNEGWGVFLNASGRTFFDVGERDPEKLVCLFENEDVDLFVFCGSTMIEILSKYHQLTGAPMLLPKYAYGLTYIAPIFANQMEVLADVERFHREHIPVDHVSLEPGWMKEFYDYSIRPEWELQRFHVADWHMKAGHPDEKLFIEALHRLHVRLSLWRCIRYDLTAEAERVLAAGSEEEYGEAWYQHLSRLVAIGIDGFKLDPADMVCCFDRMDRPRLFNGLTSMQMHNLNQILLTKQVYEGYTAQKGKRPMHHYSGGYSGIQRWSASTTGDNGGELGAMIWLETLALSGHMNTTIDMDIHHKESIHFGMLVPWAHLNAWMGVDQPWYAGDEYHQIYAEYARIRYRILPYIYSAAIEGHEDSIPMIRPMPLAYPKDRKAAQISRQYMLGKDLLVAAYTHTIYLPEGHWTDAWNGKTYEGPCILESYEAPWNRGGGLFIRGGAIIPNWKDRDYMEQYDDSEMMLDIYPWGNNTYIFREDDGESLAYLEEKSCQTRIRVQESVDQIQIDIGERCGEYTGKVALRSWRIRLHLHESQLKKKITLNCAQPDTASMEIKEDCVFQCDASDVLFR